eukprot:g20071.t2
MTRVKNVTSPRMIFGFTVVSVFAGLAGALFWDSVTLSGTLFWSLSLDQDTYNWVLASAFFMELLAGVAMFVIGMLLVLFRWTELCQVWQLNRRIKCYILLSVIATVVDLAIGIGGLVYVVYREYAPTLIVATWTMRHIHIGLDTLVLYSALGVTSKPDHNNLSFEQGSLARAKGAESDCEYQNKSGLHALRQEHRHHREPRPCLHVTADDAGGAGGGRGQDGVHSMTSSSSPDYLPDAV